jgi:hypothetical protein
MTGLGPFTFGIASTKELVTLHPDMQIVLSNAIQVYNFSIHQGARTVEEQIRNIRKRASKTLDSYHIPRDKNGHYDPSVPCLAADILPYQKGVNPWPQPNDSLEVREKKKGRFYYMQGIVYKAARDEGIAIVQGVDWDHDADFFDQSFDDLPHVQLLRKDWPPLIVGAEVLAEANEALRSVGRTEHKNK